MSSHLLLLFFFFPLTRPHEAEEWQPLPISAAVSAEIGRIGSCFCRNQPVLAQIGENLAELVRISINKKKKKKGESASWTLDAALGRVGLWCNDLGAASVLSRCRYERVHELCTRCGLIGYTRSQCT